jgi:nucleotide-binding universal stress UspA family protein
MTKPSGWRVLVATDGTPEARAAVAGAVAFPWPAGTRVTGVVARRTPSTRGRPPYFVAAFDRAYRRAAAGAQRVLARRWPDCEVTVVDATPAEAILGEARRLGVRAIAMGTRTRGRLPRLLLGSVARQVVRGASCPVLVVRGRAREFARVVVGVDGSPGSRHAIEFLASLRPPRGHRVVVVAVVEPSRLPSLALMPSAVRQVLAGEAAAENARLRAEAERHVASAARVLERAGWSVRRRVREGQPLTDLLAATQEAGAQLLVVGARGVGGMERLLLGSVAEGALTRSPVSVLVVR